MLGQIILERFRHRIYSSELTISYSSWNKLPGLGQALTLLLLKIKSHLINLNHNRIEIYSWMNGRMMLLNQCILTVWLIDQRRRGGVKFVPQGYDIRYHDLHFVSVDKMTRARRN